MKPMNTGNIHASEVGRPLAGVHYHLEAYVCRGGCTKPSPFEGWATFTLIFQQRPHECRYAVARLVPVFSYEPAGPYLCWDLWDDSLLGGQNTQRNGLITPPFPLWQGPSPDALIMKAVMLYDRE